MSTSGSGFTPGPSNLVYAGLSTNFVFPTTNGVEHYFKAVAVDVFNQQSAVYAADDAIPVLSTGLDLTPPPDPTDVEVTTTAVADGSSKIDVTWTAVSPTILGGYIVRYSLDEVAWQYINVPADQEFAVISGLLPDTGYYVAVASVSFVNTLSNFIDADFYPITTAADTVAPSKPADPTVSVNTLSAQVSHDMTKDAGGDLEADVLYLEVHASTTNGFTADTTTLRGTIASGGQGIDVAGTFYFTVTDSMANLYWRVIAVDRAGNKSVASDQATGLPGLIQNINITNATITSAKINDLEANKITAGTGIINDLLVKSSLTIDATGHIVSSNYNLGGETGWTLDTTGLTIFDGTIAAKALLLQDSNNIALPPFTDFQFNNDYYHSGNVPNASTMTSSAGVSLALSSTAKFGTQSLRIFNGAITNPTTHTLTFALNGQSATGVNIDLSPGTYILSAYLKKNGSINQDVKLNVYTDASTALISSAFAVTSTSWTRFETTVVIASGIAKVKIYLEFGPQAADTGYDFLIDGLQFERKMTAQTTASPFKPPSYTSIDGGQIVTGSIRSSAASSTVPSQPAWSINTAGNMQIGDALVRGSLIVGNSADLLNLIPVEFSNFESDASYYHTAANIPQYIRLHPDPEALSSTTIKLELVSSGAQFNSKALRLFTTLTPTTSTVNLWLAPRSSSGSTPTTAQNNIFVVPGETYIISAYVKSNDIALNQTFNFRIFSDASNNVTVGTATAITSTSYTRIHGSWTAPASLTTCQVALRYANTGATTALNMTVDGVMLEKAAPGQTTPSTYLDPAVGVSYAKSSTYVANQSGWYINDGGYAEFNDIKARGTLQSANYVSGSSGWIIDKAGTAEFNNVTVRGNLDVTSALGSVFAGLLLSNGAPSVKVTGASAGDSTEIGVSTIFFSDNDVASDANITFDQSSLSSGKPMFKISTSGSDSTMIILREDSSNFGEILVNQEIVAANPSTAGNSEPTSESWHDVTFNGALAVPWTNVGSPYANVGYRLMPDGTVLFRGLANVGTRAAFTTIFTLPTGYRPAVQQFLGFWTNAVGAETPTMVIDTAGVCQIFRLPTATAAGFDNVRFPLGVI
jgi:hypothetical protein